MPPVPADPTTVVWLAVAGIAAGVVAIRLSPSAWIARPRIVLAGLGGVSLAAAAYLVQLDPPGLAIVLDASEEPLMVAGDPARAVYDHAARTFGSDDTYVVAMSTDDVFTTEHLQALQGLGDAALQLPGVRRAESLADIHSYRYDPVEDRLEIDRFFDDVPTRPAELADLRRRALSDPIYPRLVVSRDGRTAAVNLFFRSMPDRAFIEQRLDEHIRGLAAGYADEGRSFYFTGRPHVKSRTHRVMVADLVRLIPLCVLVASVTVWVMTRSKRTVLLPLAACLTATLWTFGLLAALGTPLNLVTIVLGPTLIALGGLYGVHVMGRYALEAADAADPREAALRTLRYAWLPVAMAGFTTCVGFGALTLADVRATTELGLFAVFGIASLTLVSLAGIPACLALLPLPTGPPASSPVERVVDRGLTRVARFTCRWPGWILLAWGVAAAAALLAIPRIVIDTDYLTFFDARSNVRRHFDAVNRLLVGPVPLYVTFRGSGEGTFREPAQLRGLAELQRRIEALPGVSTTLSMVDILRTLNRQLERDDPAQERIPASRGAVSDLVFMVPKDQMRRFASSDHSAANILVRTGELGSRSIRRLVAEIDAVLEADGVLPLPVETSVTGNAVVLNRSADHVAGDQLSAVGTASAAILLLMTWAFRSPRLGLLAMLPNAVPVLVFFGLLGAGVASLSLPTGLIGSVTLGVAIDDTVHFLVSYRRARAGGATPEEAVGMTLRRVGRPIVVTSVMLVAGFLTITLSGFATIREFGVLTALTMAICLSTDLLLLPALLVRARV